MSALSFTRGCEAALDRPAVLRSCGRHVITRGLLSLSLHLLDVAYTRALDSPDRADTIEAAEKLCWAAIALATRDDDRADHELERAVDLVPGLGSVSIIAGLLGGFEDDAR